MSNTAFEKKLKKMSPNEIVDLIHADFDGAVNEILADAQDIIDAGTKYTEEDKRVVEEMEALGFTNFSNATDIVDEADKINKAGVTKYLAKHYLGRYTQKFITEEKVEEICKKYSLVMGPPRAYVGEPPEKPKGNSQLPHQRIRL